jgi:adenylate kinase
VCDELESMLVEGGNLVDFHSCDFFPERWFQLVLVLSPSLPLLHQRLSDRGYSEHKIQENLQCEIMEVVAEEARSSYPPEIIVSLPSNTIDDLESNIDRLEAWLKQYLLNQESEE